MFVRLSSTLPWQKLIIGKLAFLQGENGNPLKMPDVKGMGREEADAWAAHRFAEWHRWERGDADVDVDDEA